MDSTTEMEISCDEEARYLGAVLATVQRLQKTGSGD